MLTRCQEAKAGTIDLPDHDPLAVKMMIRYLYTGTYTPPSTFVPSKEDGQYWEVYEKEYDEEERERLRSIGVVFCGNRVLRRRVEVDRPFESNDNLQASATPITPQSTGQPQVSLNPSVPSTAVTAQPQGSASRAAPAARVSTGPGVQPRVSINPPATPTPVASTSRAQTQHFGFSDQRGRRNSRNRRRGRRSGNQRGNHPPNFGFASAPATPARAQATFLAQAPFPAQAPVLTQAIAPATISSPAPATPASPSVSTPTPIRTPVLRKPNLVLHAKIYALGEKYEIRDLKALAFQKFSFEILKHHSSSSFREAAWVAYTSTVDGDRGMRNVVIDTVVKHRYLLQQEAFQQVVKETELGFDLLMRLAQHKCNN